MQQKRAAAPPAHAAAEAATEAEAAYQSPTHHNHHNHQHLTGSARRKADRAEKTRLHAERKAAAAAEKEAERYASADFVLRVVCAAGLAKADTFGKSDPYCVVTWCGAECHRTAVVKKTLDPIWPNESVPLKLPLEGAASLCIDCFDEDLVGSHDFLGQVLLGEAEIASLAGAGKPMTLTLAPRTGAKKKQSKFVKGALTLLLQRVAAAEEISEYEEGFDDDEAESSLAYSNKFDSSQDGLEDDGVGEDAVSDEFEAGEQSNEGVVDDTPMISGELAAASPSSFHPFQRVTARYKGGAEFFPGSIANINPDGTYAVGYDDGDMEMAVQATHIRAEGETDAAQDEARPAGLLRDQAVYSRYGGLGVYFRGSVNAVDKAASTCGITYDDGDTEQDVPFALVKAVEQALFEVDEAVMCRYANGETSFPGKIAAVRQPVDEELFCRYDVLYADGDTEQGVVPEQISVVEQPVAEKLAAPAQKVPRVAKEVKRKSFTIMHPNQEVYCRYQGKGTYFAATITDINEAAATMEIAYDDGDAEQGVLFHFVKPLSSALFDLHEPVECKYGGGAEAFPGQIAAIHKPRATGQRFYTYDVLYDDGDSETKVPPERISMLV